MNIKILGSGCSRCIALEKKVVNIINQQNIAADIQKVTFLEEIMKYGIMMTPGLVINDKVVSYGSIPKDEQIIKWIEENK
jgi:small redox-active disulfide protein 2